MSDEPIPGVSAGKKRQPIFALFCGVRGVGKTTLVSQAPNPVFLGLERGSYQIETNRYHKARTYEEFEQQIDRIRKGNHPYNSVILDTVDVLETLIWKKVCSEGGVQSINHYAGGFGKGFVRASEIWRELMDRLEDLARTYHVLLVAHVQVKNFDDPTQPTSYQRYELKLNERAIAAICEPVDLIGFCMFKKNVIRDRSTNETRAYTEGERVMFTRVGNGWDCAKNRFNLPLEMPLDWKNLAEKIKAFYLPPAAESAEPEPPETN